MLLEQAEVKFLINDLHSLFSSFGAFKGLDHVRNCIS